MLGCSETPFIFQQNNASCHTVGHTRIFHALRGIELPWPIQSPGINIIENAWLFLKRKLQINPLKNEKELMAKAFED